MTDIVERLRYWQNYRFYHATGLPLGKDCETVNSACKEAADELERLRKRADGP